MGRHRLTVSDRLRHSGFPVQMVAPIARWPTAYASSAAAGGRGGPESTPTRGRTPLPPGPARACSAPDTAAKITDMLAEVTRKAARHPAAIPASASREDRNQPKVVNKVYDHRSITPVCGVVRENPALVLL